MSMGFVDDPTSNEFVPFDAFMKLAENKSESKIDTYNKGNDEHNYGFLWVICGS
jgi:hypothetical protein